MEHSRPVAPLRRGEDNIFVWAATTGNITLSGEQTIDGEDLVAGDYCLVWKQTDPTENAVYRVKAADWDRLGQIGLVAVRFGSQYKESMFGLTEVDTYKQISGAPTVVVVKACATSNTSTSGTTTIDSVAVVADDLVLLTAQTTAADRAVWKVSAGAWEKQNQPALVVVASGTLYGGTAFFLSTTNTYTGLGAYFK
jgi:hypothetical protein